MADPPLDRQTRFSVTTAPWHLEAIRVPSLMESYANARTEAGLGKGDH